MLQLLINTRGDINPIYQNLLIAHVPQRCMQNCSIFREVDLLALEHRISELLDLSLFCNLYEKLEGFFREEVLGKVEEDLAVVGSVVELEGELGETFGVFLKFFLQDE
jgi:hypothetical protein